MILSIPTFNITRLSITPLSIVTLSIMTLSIKILSIMFLKSYKNNGIRISLSVCSVKSTALRFVHNLLICPISWTVTLQ